jgi:hypothetical protein
MNSAKSRVACSKCATDSSRSDDTLQSENEHQHRFVAHFLWLYILFFGFRFRFHVRTLRSHHTTPGHRLLHP